MFPETAEKGTKHTDLHARGLLQLFSNFGSIFPDKAKKKKNINNKEN